MKRICEAFEYEIKESDIDDCHRLSSKKKQEGDSIPQRFIIRFTRRMEKRNFFIHCKKKRLDGTAFGSMEKEKVFVNEHTTPSTHDLLMYAKGTLKKYGFRVDTRNCVVHVKMENWSHGRPIYSRDQVDVLVNQYVGTLSNDIGRDNSHQDLRSSNRSSNQTPMNTSEALK